MTISDPGRGLVRRLGVTAAALFAFAAASHQPAEALSLASPGTAPSAKFATDDLTTEVRHARPYPYDAPAPFIFGIGFGPVWW